MIITTRLKTVINEFQIEMDVIPLSFDKGAFCCSLQGLLLSNDKILGKQEEGTYNKVENILTKEKVWMHEKTIVNVIVPENFSDFVKVSNFMCFEDEETGKKSYYPYFEPETNETYQNYLWWYHYNYILEDLPEQYYKEKTSIEIPTLEELEKSVKNLEQTDLDKIIYRKCVEFLKNRK